MKIEHLNATFQPAKIGHPHGLQVTYLRDNSTRNIFIYHEDGKVGARPGCRAASGEPRATSRCSWPWQGRTPGPRGTPAWVCGTPHPSSTWTPSVLSTVGPSNGRRTQLRHPLTVYVRALLHSAGLRVSPPEPRCSLLGLGTKGCRREVCGIRCCSFVG